MKPLFTLLILLTLIFTSCSEDEDANNTCKTCDNLEAEICDNGDGTADYIITAISQEITVVTIPIPKDGTINDINCSDLENIETDIEFK